MNRSSFDAVLRHVGPLLRVALLVVAGDLLTKQAAVWVLADADTVYSTWLRLTLVHNDAAPLGMTFGPWTFHINWALKSGAILLMLAATRDLARIDPDAPVALGLIVGAALGNLTSLFIHEAGVVDFIAFGIGAGGELVLNGADIAAYAGLALLGRTAWRVYALARSPARGAISERLRGRDIALRLVGDREIVRTVAVVADAKPNLESDLWVPRHMPQYDKSNPAPVAPVTPVTPIFDERPRSMGIVDEEERVSARVIDLRTRRASNEDERLDR